MSTTAELVVDIIGSKELASMPGGHATIRKLCQEMRALLEVEIQRLNQAGSLGISEQKPQGDDIHYRLQGTTLQDVADISLKMVIAAFSSTPYGKLFRYVLYTLEPTTTYQPRIKTFGGISKTKAGKKYHIAVERGLVSELNDPEIVNWLKAIDRVSISLPLKGEPWTGVRVDLFCAIDNKETSAADANDQTKHRMEDPATTLRGVAGDDDARQNESKSPDSTGKRKIANLGGRKAFEKHVLLTADERTLLHEILETAGMPRKAIAEAAAVSQSWLSQMLAGRSVRIDAERLERVTNILAEALINRGDNALFSKERIRVAMRTLSRFSSVAAQLVPPRTYAPGGPVPVDSSHYIRRKADDESLNALQQIPFTMIVKGPVQCGKSSILARLEHKALELGVETAWFDPRLPVSPLHQAMENKAEVNNLAVKQLADLLQVQWALPPFPTDTTDPVSRLVNWLLRATRPTAQKPRLLILDDLSRLGTDLVEDFLSRFVRKIHNERATYGLELSIAIGMAPQFGGNFSDRLSSISSVVHWWPRIELGWFSRRQADELAAKLKSSVSENQSFYDHFAGQPYLTHAALMDHEFAESVLRWTNERTENYAKAIRESQTYRRHLSAIRFAVMGRPIRRAGDETKELVRTFAEACNGREPVYHDEKLFFETAKLTSNLGQPSIPIYRLVADDLGELIMK